MKNTQNRAVWMALVILLVFGHQGFAGSLDEFEADATRKESSVKKEKEEKPKKKTKTKNQGSSDSLVQDVLEITLIVVGSGIVLGGIQSMAKMRGDQASNIPKREHMDPQLPLVSLSTHYQYIGSRVSAFDTRLEGGYGPFALQYRRTHYREEKPNAEMDISQYHGLYRMTFTPKVSMDIGLGTAQIKGSQRNNGFAYTLPLHVYPAKWLEITLRPSWYVINGSNNHDHDIGIAGHKKWGTVRMGYRWVGSTNRSLNGPYVGVDVRF